jgi:hypothetical protein
MSPRTLTSSSSGKGGACCAQMRALKGPLTGEPRLTGTFPPKPHLSCQPDFFTFSKDTLVVPSPISQYTSARRGVAQLGAW